MTSRTAAARYARAVFDVAIKESTDLDRIARELDEFASFLKEQPALERVMLNPAVPAPRKRAAMEQLTSRSGFTPVVSKLLVLLADRDRSALLKDIAAIYHDLLADGLNVVRAEITSAERAPAGHGGAASATATASLAEAKRRRGAPWQGEK